MPRLDWDKVGERFFETGVDRGVLYVPDVNGVYGTGFAWNGLTTVTESPSGAEATPLYADNIKYLNLTSAEQFGATLEAYTYPELFAQCDGSLAPQPGVAIGQQTRKLFGLCYRTRLGNDVTGSDFGYKLHMIYGAKAAPSEKAYATINDTPEAITFSWSITTSPVAAIGYKPTAIMTVDSSKVTAAKLLALENILFGTATDNPRLPLPDEVIAVFGAGVVAVDMVAFANQPSYNITTHVVTLPTVTGVQWKVNGVNKVPGAQPALAVGETATVQAVALAGYNLVGDSLWTYSY